MDILQLACVIYLLRSSLANYVRPTVDMNSNSCQNQRAEFTITNMSAGGLIYIRTYQAFNVLPTVDGTMIYGCIFEDCGINWNVKFKVVVQRKVMYQSSNDVTATYLCMGNIEPVLSISSSANEKDDENMTTVVYKPEVAMTFYDSGSELQGGSTIKLGTNVDVKIEITNNFQDFFDIAVMTCYMSSIPLFEDFCPLHADVLGEFTRVSNGNLTNAFRMFKPTTTMGSGSIAVIISCVLKVCQETCTWSCDSGARRRRDKSERSQVGETNVLDNSQRPLGDGASVEDNNVYVGKMFTVVTEGQTEATDQGEEPSCLDIAPAAAMLGVLAILLAFSFTFFVYVFYQYLRQNTSDIKKKREIKEVVDNQVLPNGKNVNGNVLPSTGSESVKPCDESKELDEKPSVNGRDRTDTSSSGEDNAGFDDTLDTLEEPVLYTNKERRRSSKIEIPLMHLQQLISKFGPAAGLAKGIIMYKGIKKRASDSTEPEPKEDYEDNCSDSVFTEDEKAASTEHGENDQQPGRNNNDNGD